MFERFTKDARAVVKTAQSEAGRLGSPTIEAEHLLLALADHPVLDKAGLDRAMLLHALDVETARSLAAVGVDVADFEIPAPRPVDSPKFATSSKNALERTVKVALAHGDKRITNDHVLIALLSARAGTVPRALGAIDVDPVALRTAVETAIDAG
jgi:ATP-dependent Clp protease ATP-binding subunit ClpA